MHSVGAREGIAGLPDVKCNSQCHLSFITRARVVVFSRHGAEPLEIASAQVRSLPTRGTSRKQAHRKHVDLNWTDGRRRFIGGEPLADGGWVAQLFGSPDDGQVGGGGGDGGLGGGRWQRKRMG